MFYISGLSHKTGWSIIILGLTCLLVAASEIPTTSPDTVRQFQTAPCTPESAKNTSGKWTVEVKNYVSSPESPSLLKQLEAEAELLHKAIGDPPIGFNAEGVIDFPKPSTSKNPQSISINAPFYYFYCDDGKLEVDDEYSDEAWIVSNRRGGTRFKIGTKSFHLLGSPIGEIRGYPAFEWDWTASPSGNCATFSWSVLVTKKGKSPYRYASRKEILDHLFQVIEKQRLIHVAGCDVLIPIRPPEVQAAEKQKELASFLTGAKDEATRKKWTDRFNNDYRTDQQKVEELKQKMTAWDDKTVANLKTVQARYSPDELMQTAYVYNWLTNYDTEFNEDDFEFDLPKIDPDCRPADYSGSCDPHHMGKPFAIVKSDYFDANLPNNSPQYFMVGIKWTACKSTQWRNEIGEKLRDDFFARFDFEKLEAMLGR